MSFDVKTVALADICSDVSYGYTASASAEPVGPKFLRITDIQGGTVDWDNVPYCEISESKLSKNLLLKGDIVVARTGNSTGENYMYSGDDPSVFASYLIRFKVDHSLANPHFVWLQMRTRRWWDFVSGAKSGSAQAGANAKVLGKFEVSLPPRKIQDHIVNIVSTLSEKIHINTQTNQTLEQMAHAIFKSWFVDFDPVKAKMNGEQPEGMDATTASLFPEKLVESELGLIPEGWEVNQLSDICKNHSQSYNLKSVDEVVFVNTGDVQEGDFLHKNYSPVIGLPGQAKKAIKEDDILYSEIRPKNKRFAYVDFDVSDYVVSTKFMVIQANEKVHPRLLYMILTRQNTIDEFNIIADSRSGTFPQITFKAISNLEFCMAPREIQDSFVSQIMPMIKLQSSLKSENKQLAEMRDTLLPKLLSGEIELETTEELVEVN